MALWTDADFLNTRWVERNVNAIYCGKHGDDRNDGHPTRPVQTVARAQVLAIAANQPILFDSALLFPVVISSGIYMESDLQEHCLLIGDGFVTFNGAGAAQLTNGLGSRQGFRNITIRNYVSVAFWNASTDNTRVFDCVYFHPGNYGLHYLNLANSLFVNTPQMQYTLGVYLEMRVTNSTFINSLIKMTSSDSFRASAGFTIRNSYIDPTSEIQRPENSPYRLTSCNIQGLVGGFKNTPGQLLEDYQLATNNAAIDCINTAPGFNNPATGDYTLQLTSPMRNLGADGGPAGAYGVGVNFGGQGDAQTLVNMSWNAGAGAHVLTNPALRGTVEYSTKDLGRAFVLQAPILGGDEDIIDGETVDAVLSYETDGGGVAMDTASGNIAFGSNYWVQGYNSITYNGQQYNTNQFFVGVVGVTAYSTVGSGKVVRLIETPNIRVLEMKYSLSSAADCNSKSYSYFVYNQIPSIDADGHTNGHPSFNAATAVPIAARWVKIRATILPNSLP